MKTRLLVLILALAFLVPACERKKPDAGAESQKKKLTPLSGTYQVDGDDSYVSFTSIKNHHLPVSGRFDGVSGSITIPDKSPEKSTGTFTLDLTTLDTGLKERDTNILQYFFEAIGDSVVGEKATFSIGPMKAKDEVTSPLPLNKPVRLIANGKMKVHDKKLSQKLLLTVTRTAEERIQVTTRDPYVFEIEKFEMVEPLNKLMEVCDHDAVSKIVPIQLHIVLAKK